MITVSINRTIINCINRIRLKNQDFSLISNNCNSAFLLHDLNVKFLTPTVNLFFFHEHFIKYGENLNFYLEQEIQFINNQDYNYPIEKLNDIEIHFMHCKDIEDAKEQWNKRINHKNIYIMMTDRDGCSEAMIRRFDNLPYKNKVIFTNRV